MLTERLASYCRTVQSASWATGMPWVCIVNARFIMDVHVCTMSYSSFGCWFCTSTSNHGGSIRQSWFNSYRAPKFQNTLSIYLPRLIIRLWLEPLTSANDFDHAQQIHYAIPSSPTSKLGSNSRVF